MTIVLTLRAAPPAPVDMTPLTPTAIAAALAAGAGAEKTASVAERVAAITLAAGNRRLRVGELFGVEGDDAAGIVIRGGGARLLRIGAGMTAGTLDVEGDVGSHAACGMQGGTLSISGSAGAFAACALAGGIVRIRGHAGDCVGGPLPGARQGMAGGTVIVGGSAGQRAGESMRRGLLLVRGDVGDWCGARMIAGTIAVRGRAGHGAGFGMRRGTLLFAHAPAVLATFADDGVQTLTFLRVLRHHLRAAGTDAAEFADQPDTVHRYVGDRGAGGLGEILVHR